MIVNTHKKVLAFSENLVNQGVHIAEHNGGQTKYFCGPEALDSYQKAYAGGLAILSTKAKHPTFSVLKSDKKQILSIGRSRLHEEARKLAWTTGLLYSTCPIPLSNDCFATDRAGGSLSRPADILTFPSDIILDWGLCLGEGFDENRFGLGEVLGLVTSVRDFAQITGDVAITNFVAEIDFAVEHLFASWIDTEKGATIKLALLGAYLSMKGLLIRVAGTNNIVAGCDHLISYELARMGLKWPHGRLIAAGVLLSIPLFRDGTNDRLKRIASFCFSVNLLRVEDLRSIIDLGIGNILKKALITRPERKTVLRQLSPEIEEHTILMIGGLYDEYK